MALSTSACESVGGCTITALGPKATTPILTDEGWSSTNVLAAVFATTKREGLTSLAAMLFALPAVCAAQPVLDAPPPDQSASVDPDSWLAVHCSPFIWTSPPRRSSDPVMLDAAFCSAPATYCTAAEDRASRSTSPFNENDSGLVSPDACNGLDDTLTVSVWDVADRLPGAYRFRTQTQRGETVIDAGLFSLA